MPCAIEKSEASSCGPVTFRPVEIRFSVTLNCDWVWSRFPNATAAPIFVLIDVMPHLLGGAQGPPVLRKATDRKLAAAMRLSGLGAYSVGGASQHVDGRVEFWPLAGSLIQQMAAALGRRSQRMEHHDEQTRVVSRSGVGSGPGTCAGTNGRSQSPGAGRGSSNPGGAADEPAPAGRLPGQSQPSRSRASDGLRAPDQQPPPVRPSDPPVAPSPPP